MEIKSAKVTRLVKGTAADSFGKWSFSLEFDNGDKGWYNTKNGDQTFFINGEVSDYLIEEKTSKSGSKYYTITHPEEKAQAPGFAKGGFRIDPKLQLASYSMSYTKDLIVGGKVALGEMEKEFNRIHALMSSKL